jgi:MoaA/NifB/PqqE/SkfB family radical SAM enzyme
LTRPGLVFDRAPLRIYWETTRACSLDCRHCRAEAMPTADPRQLTPAESLALLDRLAAFGPPLPRLVLTGGDPLERADLFTLIRRGRTLGFGVSVAPSGTPRLGPQVIARLCDEGVEAISLSLDGSTAAPHDALRGVPGCFDRTVAAASAARAAGLPFQVNTLVCAETLGDLSAVRDRVIALGAARWSLFFLVAVGRGSVLGPVTAAEAEGLLEWLAGLPPGRPVVSTTEAPHFRRVLAQRRGHAAAARAAGIRDGNGIMFISHTGEVTPSGFLELSAGDVRSGDPVALYREAPLFRALRDPDRFGGRCGRCEFRAACGGSRARAWAATGDPLAEDPLCPYDPPASA